MLSKRYWFLSFFLGGGGVLKDTSTTVVARIRTHLFCIKLFLMKCISPLTFFFPPTRRYMMNRTEEMIRQEIQDLENLMQGKRETQTSFNYNLCCPLKGTIVMPFKYTLWEIYRHPWKYVYTNAYCVSWNVHIHGTNLLWVAMWCEFGYRLGMVIGKFFNLAPQVSHNLRILRCYCWWHLVWRTPCSFQLRPLATFPTVVEVHHIRGIHNIIIHVDYIICLVPFARYWQCRE